MGDVKPTEQMKKVSLPDKKKQTRKYYISPMCAMHTVQICLANRSDGSLLLPKPRGGCIRWGLPTQTLGEELREGRSSGPGSRRGGGACACGMV